MDRNDIRSRELNRLLGFTLIELLVSITILATISIVAYTSAQSYMKRSYNSERIASIGYLKTSLSDHLQVKKTLPDPTSNAIYYSDRWAYAHSASGAYGISGFASNDFLPANYANLDATDPETKQFYAYGKRLDDSAFDLATVIYEEGTYKSYLRGTYDGKKLASLVRAYSSSDFVSDGSTEALPYNPYDRKITARIETWSGSVIINDNPSLSLTGELNMGDTISVDTGSLAVMHISDGSELIIGSASGSTVLELSSLKYSDDNNLASRVALFLRSGETWVKAPHLRTATGSESDFSIQSDSAVAAVRGTVFGLSTYQNGTNISHTDITLVDGKVEAMKKTDTDFIDPTTSTLWSFAASAGSIFTATGSFVNEGGRTYIQNTADQDPVRFGFDHEGDSISTQTGSVDPDAVNDQLNTLPFTPGYRPRVLSITSTGATGITSGQRSLSVTFENPEADRYELSYQTDTSDTSTPTVFSESLNATSSTGTASAYIENTPWKITLRLCKRMTSTICSLPFETNITAGYFSLDGLADAFDQMGPDGSKSKPKKTPPAPIVPGWCNNDPSLPAYWLETNTCKGVGLVAFAPYDKDHDLRMYIRDSTIIPYDHGLSWSGYLALNSIGLFTNDWKSNSGSASYLVGVNKLSNPGLFYDWRGVHGILMPKSTGGDISRQPASLKYELSPLNLTGSFSIEMNVRGGALTRTGWYYYLLQKNSTNETNYSFYTNADQLFFEYKKSRESAVTQSLWNIPQGLWTDDFYRVQLIFDRKATDYTHVSAKLSTNATGSPNLLISPVKSSANTSFDISFLYIGWTTLWLNQWNDIIDSVKIYQN